MKLHGAYWVQHTTRLVNGFISELNYKIDVDTMHREIAETLTLNEIGRIQLTTTQPLYYDRYQLNRGTGSFILIDPATNNTVAAGMIRGQSRDVKQLRAGSVWPSEKSGMDIKRPFCGSLACPARANRRLPKSWSSSCLPMVCTRCTWTAIICGMA